MSPLKEILAFCGLTLLSFVRLQSIHNTYERGDVLPTKETQLVQSNSFLQCSITCLRQRCETFTFIKPLCYLNTHKAKQLPLFVIHGRGICYQFRYLEEGKRMPICVSYSRELNKIVVKKIADQFECKSKWFGHSSKGKLTLSGLKDRAFISLQNMARRRSGDVVTTSAQLYKNQLDRSTRGHILTFKRNRAGHYDITFYGEEMGTTGIEKGVIKIQNRLWTSQMTISLNRVTC